AVNRALIGIGFIDHPNIAPQHLDNHCRPYIFVAECIELLVGVSWWNFAWRNVEYHLRNIFLNRIVLADV
ncbi:hypothetical protein, partial [Sutterella wadsworthensis]|uniref:hypothetical protein n=1 Tax=Sutterella wadsworthensis TaxID=40545 RepID=UPI002431567F